MIVGGFLVMTPFPSVKQVHLGLSAALRAPGCLAGSHDIQSQSSSLPCTCSRGDPELSMRLSVFGLCFCGNGRQGFSTHDPPETSHAARQAHTSGAADRNL